MIEYNWNSYQLDIFREVGKLEHNLLINAYAGTGKTTTLLRSLQEVDDKKKVIFLAFNKSIVEELKTKLPSNFPIMTFHKLGLELIRNHYKPLKVEIDPNKKQRHILNFFEREKISYKERQVVYAHLSRMIDLARVTLSDDLTSFMQTVHEYGYGKHFNYAPATIEILRNMEKDKFSVDYSDMIYLPYRKKLRNIPRFDLIFIDECQDLSLAQHALKDLIKKPSTKTIAFGDKHQMIYTFAGASPESYQKFMDMDNLKVMDLPLCYRCGKKITEYAQSIVPMIISPEENIDGKVVFESNVDNIQNGDWVLCRLNAPLGKLFKQLKDKGLNVKMLDTEFIDSVLDIVSTLKDEKDYEEQFDDILNNKIEFLESLGMESSEIENHEDYLELTRHIDFIKPYFEHENANKVKVTKTLKRIFIQKKKNEKKSNPVILTTIHKSKGLEADRVFLYQWNKEPKDEMKEWEIIQEKNLRYVAITRAKRELHIINT